MKERITFFFVYPKCDCGILHFHLSIMEMSFAISCRDYHFTLEGTTCYTKIHVSYSSVVLYSLRENMAYNQIRKFIGMSCLRDKGTLP